MILDDFDCSACAVRWQLGRASMSSPDPLCPECGGALRRRFGVNIGGQAHLPLSRDEMPHSWSAVNGGDRDLVRRWHDEAVARDHLEEGHPELAGDRRPVLAHEGIFASQPLRTGDPIPPAARD